MGRTRGAVNKQPATDPALLLTTQERIELLASIILDIITEEQQTAAQMVETCVPQ